MVRTDCIPHRVHLITGCRKTNSIAIPGDHLVSRERAGPPETPIPSLPADVTASTRYPYTPPSIPPFLHTSIPLTHVYPSTCLFTGSSTSRSRHGSVAAIAIETQQQEHPSQLLRAHHHQPQSRLGLPRVCSPLNSAGELHSTTAKMSDSEVDYLQPGFDPKSLTMPRLRSILVAHNVSYPASAKKAQLIEIFNENVLPQARKILAQRAKAKRSSKGIVDADAGQTLQNPFDDHENLAPPPSARARRSASPRKASAKIKSEEPEYEAMPPPTRSRSPTKRQPRASRRQPQVSDTDTVPEVDANTASMRPRKVLEPAAQPVPPLKKEDSEGFFRRGSGAFSNENPFQSAASPVMRTPSNRRRTANLEEPRSVSTASARRRQLENVNYEEDETANLAHKIQTPVAQIVRGKTPDPTPPHLTPEPEPYAVEAGEEFMPDEEMELAEDEYAPSEMAVEPVARASKRSGASWGSPLFVMLVTLLSIYAGWFRQEKVAVGYCGLGRTAGSLPREIPIPEWAQSVLPAEVTVPQSVLEALEPDCEPCPSHAYCFDDFSVQCEPDYILKPHPLSLGGLVPLPPTCEPDGEKARRVQAVTNKAVEELRERTAKYECGELVDEQGTKSESPAIEEQELKEVINQKRSKKMNNQEFEDLWGASIGEIKGRDEVQVEIKEE